MVESLDRFLRGLLSLVACACVGLCLGAFVAGINLTDLARVVQFIMAGCFIAMFLVAMCLVLLAIARSPNSYRRPTKSQPPAHLPEVPTPKPYEGRLAQFLECSEDQLHDQQEEPISTMPFWSRFDYWTRSKPKSVLAIRMVLERIRRTLRGRWQH